MQKVVSSLRSCSGYPHYAAWFPPLPLSDLAVKIIFTASFDMNQS